jgi:hypothetical protein
MKREMELIREIMLAVEEERDFLSIDGYSKESIKYHAALLIEAGLLHGEAFVYGSNATPNIPDDILITKISWDGHEFLDSVRKDTVWETIKTEFKDASVDTVIKVSRQLAEGWAKKRVDELLNK